MRRLGFKVLCLGLITAVLFSSGCASMQKKKRITDLEQQVAQLTQAMTQKEEQLAGCQELLNELEAQVRNLETLQNDLDKCRAQLKSSKEVMENFK